jgi:hypothetical protein
LNGGNTVMSDDASLLCDNIMRRTPPAPPQPADEVATATASAKAQTNALVSIASVSISRPPHTNIPAGDSTNHRVIHPELAELAALFSRPTRPACRDGDSDRVQQRHASRAGRHHGRRLVEWTVRRRTHLYA